MDIDVAAFGRVLAAVGIPSLIGWWVRWYVKDRKRQRQTETKDEKLIPFEVRGVAATTFEQESIQFQKATDRLVAIKDRTIAELSSENARLIDKASRLAAANIELEIQLEALRKNVKELQDKLEEVMLELESVASNMQTAREESTDDSIRLHTEPGTEGNS